MAAERTERTQAGMRRCRTGSGTCFRSSEAIHTGCQITALLSSIWAKNRPNFQKRLYDSDKPDGTGFRNFWTTAARSSSGSSSVLRRGTALASGSGVKVVCTRFAVKNAKDYASISHQQIIQIAIVSRCLTSPHFCRFLVKKQARQPLMT